MSVMIGLLPLTVSAQEEVIPSAYPVERYEPLWKKSPFALSSAAVMEAPPAGFADSLALTGVLKIGDEVLVAVMDKVTKERQMLSAKAGEQSVWVEKLEFSDEAPSKVAVTLKKGADSAVLRYDMDYLKQVAAMPAPPAASITKSNANAAAIPIVPRPANRPPIQRRIIIPSQPPPATQSGKT
ncbi:MAG: hypothetical protein LBD30_04880 [Verrucomicrobiales bacterium]|nr:hypothetical protein [Verrucomicrobiales bacterium]